MLFRSMSWRVEFRSGVWLPQIGWWLDAHFPVARSFVSHAHSDHIAAHGEILCSEATSQLMRARIQLRADRSAHHQRIAFLDPATIIAGTSITVADARAGNFVGSEIPPEYADGVHVEADFIAAIRGERQPARAVPRFEDARQLLQFGEVWKESSQKGGWCDLP